MSTSPAPTSTDSTLIVVQPQTPSSQTSLFNLRIATLIWFGFNGFIALVLIFRIYFTTARERKAEFRKRLEEANSRGRVVTEKELKGRRKWWEVLCVPTDEAFPLVLGVGMAIQAVVMSGFVAMGLNGAPERNTCRRSGEAVWTAIWIPIYINLVFQMECLIRTLSTPRLRPRGKYAFYICISIICLLLFITWIPTHFIAPENTLCNGQLVQYVNHFAPGGMALLALLIPVFVVAALITFMHLSRAVPISEIERRSACKIVYFSWIGALQWALLIPFFATSNANKISRPLAFLATVVLGISPVFANLLFIYLRSKLKYIPSPSIPPKDESAIAQPREFHQVTDRLPVQPTPPMEDGGSTFRGQQAVISGEIMDILSSSGSNASVISPVAGGYRGNEGQAAYRPPVMQQVPPQAPMFPRSAQTPWPAASYPTQQPPYPAQSPPPPIPPIPQMRESTMPAGRAPRSSSRGRPQHKRTYSIADKPPAPRPASALAQRPPDAYHHSRNSSTSSSTGLLSTVEGSLPISYDGDGNLMTIEERLYEARKWTRASSRPSRGRY